MPIPPEVPSMDEIQERHERAVGQDFINWYNREHRTAFVFLGRAGEAPDLVFRDGDHELKAEVATAYYNFLDAKIRWMHARNAPDAPTIWMGTDLEASLVKSINGELADKCAKAYGVGCVLLISVMPNLTTAAMMRDVWGKLALPERNPFEGIYVVGQFAPSSRLGYQELQIKQLA